ncbi:protein LONG AFTER FAR-RED 3 isoform X2 [Lathyrus oleraceus]|uniref:protein LONG AFTER FAR-RED 3 isoform X2 n=1 Tax=Pisum sativum TaxID=3888 RepID=UPI0021CFB50A|nr:protein LONG AFTER FAR-RED 3 isoform X2 [Pisum sativum]
MLTTSLTFFLQMNFLTLLSASISLLLAILIASLHLLQPTLDFLPWKNLQKSPLPLEADLIIRNGVIFTSDESLPFAHSMAVANGRVLRIGNNSFVQEVAGYGTQVLDLEGKVVLPGFIDSHVHFISGGLQVGLRGVNKKEEVIRRIKEAVESTKPGSWILGGGWNNDQWGGDLPAAYWIDDITPNNPVWLSRMDGHMGWANSVTLRLAGITNSTESPRGGTIVRSADGEPTGLLVDSAMTLVVSRIPELSIDDRREALQKASNLALTKGVTTVVDMGRYFPGVSADLPWEDFTDVYQWTNAMSKMKVRVCLFFPMETWPQLADLVNKMGRALSQWVYFGGVKAFFDGSLGSNSALFYEPYQDEPDNYGLQLADLDALLNMTLESDLSGLQIAIHAIGDKANDLILDLHSSVASKNGMRDRRFRIEHAQHLAPGSPTRFGKEGVAASVQPDHLLDDADSVAKKLGNERAVKESYLFKSLLESNALVALGSDWPVADINPLSGINSAVKRKPPNWKDAWIPSECISLEEAIKGYTISAARASFIDDDLGSLSIGKLADFVILSTDSWKDFAETASASLEATYVSGVKAYP